LEWATKLQMMELNPLKILPQLIQDWEHHLGSLMSSIASKKYRISVSREVEPIPMAWCKLAIPLEWRSSQTEAEVAMTACSVIWRKTEERCFFFLSSITLNVNILNSNSHNETHF